MILPLRQNHRRIFSTLGIILPVTFVIGMAARSPLPVLKAAPQELSSVNKSSAMLWERADLFSKVSVSVQLLQSNDKPAAGGIRLTATKNFVKPDLLVYWVPGSANVGDALPADAVLLGAFDMTALPINESIIQSSGRLVLFSLADSEVVDATQPLTLRSSIR